MSRVRVEVVGEGQHPSERVVVITTADGSRERVIVDRDSIEDSMIDIGFPVGGDEDRLLVELPRETINGAWRVWMRRADVVGSVAA
jgi:hypothetical protein